jgi:hypothetical protein
VCGRKAFELGVAAYRTGDFPTAIREFHAALAFKWHPSIALNLGLAEARAGQYLASIQEFEAVLGNAASDAKLRDEATKERDQAKSELATIELDTAGGTPASVRVDGVSVNAAEPVLVDPGTHHVEIDMPGGSPVRRDVTLTAREHLRLSIDRTREMVMVPNRVEEKPKRDERPPPPRRHGVAPVWFFVGAGAAVVAGAVTTWSALDTESAFDSYQSDLPKLSQVEANQRVDNGHSLEARTNVLLAVTGVLALGSAALGVFLVEWHPSTESALVVGPGLAAFRGHF